MKTVVNDLLSTMPWHGHSISGQVRSGQVSRNGLVRSSQGPGSPQPSAGRWRRRCRPGGSPGPCGRGSGGRRTRPSRTRQHSLSECRPWNTGRTAGSGEDLQDYILKFFKNNKNPIKSLMRWPFRLVNFLSTRLSISKYFLRSITISQAVHG